MAGYFKSLPVCSLDFHCLGPHGVPTLSCPWSFYLSFGLFFLISLSFCLIFLIFQHMFMIWETFWRHKRSKNKFRRLVCLFANFEMHNLVSFVWWVFYFSLIWEHLDPFKKNKRVSLIKKMVLEPLGDEIWPTLCPVKGSASTNGWLKTAVSGFSGFYYFRFLQFLVSSVIGSVSEIPVWFPVSSSVHKFPSILYKLTTPMTKHEYRANILGVPHCPV